MLRYKILFLLSVLFANALTAQMTPLSYQQASFLVEQSFNSLPVSGTFNLSGKGPHHIAQLTTGTASLKGWYILQTAGSQPNTVFSVSTGSATSSGVYSYGAANSPNRALGSLAAGTGVYAFGLLLKNETGLILNRIQINFLSTQWRKGGSGNKNTWLFGYLLDDTIQTVSLDDLIKEPKLGLSSIHSTTGAATLNGHLPVNQLWVEDSINNIIWLPGKELLLLWYDSDETGSDDAMAIDDFSFKAWQQTGLPVISTPVTDSIGATNVLLSTLVNDQLSNTTVELEIDTSENFTSSIKIPAVMPSEIVAGSGNVKVQSNIEFLSPAKKYHYRFKASNQQGVVYGNIEHFTTKFALSVVQTDSLLPVHNNSCLVFGSVQSTGGDTVWETGVCWGEDSLPSIQDNSILIADKSLNFQTVISQLASGKKNFFRTYCKNTAGIAYGNTLSWFIPTSVTSFKRNGFPICNKDTIVYEIRFKEKVSGITTADFYLITEKDSDASIIEAKETALSWLIAINTGNQDGSIRPVFLNRTSYEPAVTNAPDTANITFIDKTKPVIRSVHVANRPYKTGDTINVFIHTAPEKGLLNLVAGNLSGYPFQELIKENDSCWKTFSIIKNTGIEITAEDHITTSIVLRDEAGNQNNPFTFTITQDNDAIDLTRPAISRIVVPGQSIFKSGDSLFFQIHFSEGVVLDSTNGKPVLSVTIGTRIRNPFLYNINHKSMFTFCYIIQSDESDMDGIRIASSITLNNAVISDAAGNLLNNTIPNAGVFSNLKVDGVAPVVTNVITPIAKTYGLGDSLYFQVFVSEPLLIPAAYSPPHLNITVGNSIYRLTHLPQTNNPLVFYWTVPASVADKNGLAITNLLFNSDYITDSSGNKMIPVLKNIGSLTNVIIDGIVPVFRTNSIRAEVCGNGSIQLNELLKPENTEEGEMLYWTLLTNPVYGSIEGFPFSSKATTVIPLASAAKYVSFSKEATVDECIIQVSDGVNKAVQKIILQVSPKIANNTITADQLICEGFSAEPLQGGILSGGNGIFRFQWESANRENIFKNANGINDQAIYHPMNVSAKTSFRRIVSSGGCMDTSNSIVVDVRSNGLWLGKQSDNWNTGSNWCGGTVPDRLTDVFILSAGNRNNVTINDSAYCRSLYADSSTTISVTGTLLFTASLYGQNNIDAANGTIVAAGKQKQLLQTGIFSEKTVGRLIAAGVHLELRDTLQVKDYFSVHKGIFNTNDALFLNQRAVNHPNAPGSNLKGTVSINRTVTGKQKAMFMHHPFKNGLSVQLTNGSNFASGADAVSFGRGFSLNDSIYFIASSESQNKNIPHVVLQSVAIAGTTKWPDMKGLILSNPFTQVFTRDTSLLTFRGALAYSDTEFDFGIIPDNRYLLTGNPFLCPVNSKHIAKSDGIGNYYWIWDTSLAENGAFRAKAFAANNTIQAFDGMLIKTLAAKPSWLIYSEEAKMVTPVADSLEACIENTHQLEIELLKEQIVHDKLLLLDTDTARTRYDAADAEKIFNPQSNLYSLSTDTIPLSIDARRMSNRTVIPLGIEVKSPGDYMFRFSRVWLKPGIVLELYDNYTGSKVRIDTNKTYRFAITQDTSSFGRQRFLISSPLQPEPPEEVLQLKLYPVPAWQILNVTLQARAKAYTTIFIKNLHGQTIQSRKMGEQQSFTVQLSLDKLLPGSYFAEVHSGKYVIAKPFIKL